ncbi:hypothetical protein BurJ1DRAFT_3136 [Burkholderiales bacterium JOSHI_001]|nr:hypothetical protein BurJ1DRAFT_3136 [Burkholderiales bacterium JOSHI_001]
MNYLRQMACFLHTKHFVTIQRGFVTGEVAPVSSVPRLLGWFKLRFQAQQSMLLQLEL